MITTLRNVLRRGLARIGIINARTTLAAKLRAYWRPATANDSNDKDGAGTASSGSSQPSAKPPPRQTALPNWRRIVSSDERWSQALASRAGQRVLIATSVGGHTQFTVVESAIAAALTLRGANVDVLVCDGALSACQRAKITGINPSELSAYGLGKDFCPGCRIAGEAVMSIPGISCIQYSGILDDEDREKAKQIAETLSAAEIAAYQYNGLPIGEHAKAGALRYYGVGDLSLEPDHEGVLRRYLESSLLTAFALERVLRRGQYDVVLINHGIYVPHGIVNAVARKHGIRTVTWNLAYRQQCAIFSHGDTYHHTLMSEPASDWENMRWSAEHDTQIKDYLDSRRGGKRDWIWFNRDADDDMEAFARASGIDWSKPVIGMLTNVVWDAQLHYPANAFPSMLDWVQETVKYFSGRPDLQLLIRVHPGELAPPGGNTVSRQPAVEEIKKAFPTLPKNVFIIAPESKVSTYAAMERCNAVIIYGTKTGVELTSTGIPVIVAGEAWIRNKGLTRDAVSPQDYLAILATLPFANRMDAVNVTRARKYAYHFFFRRMLPLPFLAPRADHWPPFVLELSSVSDLETGRYPGLDVVCDGILNGSAFIYKAEELGLHDRIR